MSDERRDFSAQREDEAQANGMRLLREWRQAVTEGDRPRQRELEARMKGEDPEPEPPVTLPTWLIEAVGDWVGETVGQALREFEERLAARSVEIETRLTATLDQRMAKLERKAKK